MRTLTPKEKRTIRRAGIAIACYLVLFIGYHTWKRLEARRLEYRKVVLEANILRQEVQPYREKAGVVKELMEGFHMDPARLSRSSIVADASAAIQKAATSGGIQFGPIRESSARTSNKELTTMQLEGSGPVPALMAFLHNLQSLGYPLVIDSVQIHGDPSKPGAVKISLTIVILDFDQWKQETPHA